METKLMMFLKFFMLLFVIAGAMAGNVKGLPPCCPTEPIECQPISCPMAPCCHPPPSDMKSKNFEELPSILNQSLCIEKKNHLSCINYINKTG
jgi:hypothetical protein